MFDSIHNDRGKQKWWHTNNLSILKSQELSLELKSGMHGCLAKSICEVYDATKLLCQSSVSPMVACENLNAHMKKP